MKILLINPNTQSLYGREYLDEHAGVQKIALKIVNFPRPLSLPVLAALTPKEHEVKMIDAAPIDVNYDQDCDLVAISFTTRYAPLAYQIADNFRKRGVKVVVGGWHPSALPDEAKQHADAVVIGEAEYLWVQIIEDAKKNNLKPFYMQDRPTDPNDIPFPLNLYPKNIAIGVQATRGCPYGCEYCAITHAQYRNIFRMRPIENVIREIKNLSQNTFVFFDNSLTINPAYTKKLFNAMIEEGVNKKFTCFGNINILGKDDELLKLANRAGCVGWLIGLESVSQESLQEVFKKTNIVKDYKSSIQKIHDHNMFILGNFMFGFDHDTLDVFDKTIENIKTCEVDVPDIMILTPLPGTPLFKRLDKEGRILTKDWSRYNFEEVVFKPKNMEPEELLYHSRRVFKEVYTSGNILWRSLRAYKLGIYTMIDVSIRNFYLSKKRYQ